MLRDKSTANYKSWSKRQKEYITEITEGQELKKLLDNRLQEEVEEYLESDEVEELADILEVIHCILEYKNISLENLEKIRIKKKEERGGFSEGIKFIKVNE